MADSSTGTIGAHILACSAGLYQRPLSVANKEILHTTASRWSLLSHDHNRQSCGGAGRPAREARNDFAKCTY